MNAIEYTNNLIISEFEKQGIEQATRENYLNSKVLSVLVVGPEYNIENTSFHFGAWVGQVDMTVPEGDLAEWINEHRKSNSFRLFDFVVLSRVYEHFEVRNIDWYTYQLSTVMKKGARLACVVPDMPKVAEELEKCFDKDGKITDEFKFKRLNYELLSEGPDILMRHSFWSSKASTKHYLEQEKLFKVESIKEVVIDSSIVPPELEFIAVRT